MITINRTSVLVILLLSLSFYLPFTTTLCLHTFFFPFSNWRSLSLPLSLPHSLSLSSPKFFLCLFFADQNDKLRSEIQNEEREIAKKMIEAEIAAARKTLDLEKQIGPYQKSCFAHSVKISL